jgi:nitrogen fixation/metabolism regulation signal transduction histidine kinase
MTTDASLVSRSVLKFNQDLGIMANGQYSANQATFDAYVADTVFGNISAVNAQIQNSIVEDVQAYLIETSQAVILNDIYNTNDYVTETIYNEKKRTGGIKDKTASLINKTRQSYLQKKYSIEYNNFVSMCLQFTTFIVLIVAIMFTLLKQDKINNMVAYLISAIAILIFLIGVVLYVKNNQVRRKDDWNKYYFPSMNGSTSGSCAT